MSIRVKICGITNLEDALAAVAAGADALGFMFYARSKRFIEAYDAREIIARLPANVRRVGVFVNADAADVQRLVESTGIDTLQFHGEESPEYCEQFRPLKIWKAFRIQNADSLRIVRRFRGVDALLLDSHVAGVQGGTGHTFDWSLAVQAGVLGQPIILAGGLNPENVAAAVRQARPDGLDVSSGVESAPGRKDPETMRTFIQTARHAALEQDAVPPTVPDIPPAG